MSSFLFYICLLVMLHRWICALFISGPSIKFARENEHDRIKSVLVVVSLKKSLVPATTNGASLFAYLVLIVATLSLFFQLVPHEKGMIMLFKFLSEANVFPCIAYRYTLVLWKRLCVKLERAHETVCYTRFE